MHFSKMHFRKMHFSKILQIFGGLVLGCIKTKFCKKICVRQHFSSSTRFASFCTAAISKFSQKIGLKKQQFSWKFSKNFANVAKFPKYCQISKISAWKSGRSWKMLQKLQNAYFLAKSVPIQPKTSNILPKFWQKSPTKRDLASRPVSLIEETLGSLQTIWLCGEVAESGRRLSEVGT